MKVVLTGAPCSGKTTLIDELKSQGYDVINESARRILSERYSSGKIDPRSLQYDILEAQLLEESRYNGSLVFLDRGCIDVLAYSEHLLGSIPDDFKKHDFRKMYDLVFLLERLPFLHDGIRIEKDDSEAGILHSKILHYYKENGYEPIILPLSGIKERASLVLDHVKKMKGGI